MQNTHFTTKIGLVLRDLRIERKMTQEDLYKFGTDDEIISKRHAARVENGTNDPQPEALYKLLEVLQVSLEEIEQRLYGGDKVLFDNDFAVLWEHGFSGRMDEFVYELEELKQKDYCNQNIPSIRQAILLCDSVVLTAKIGNHEASLFTLYEALQITRPKLLTKTNNIRYGNIHDAIFSIPEYRVLRQMAVVLDKLGNNVAAYNLEKAVISSLENENLNYGVRKKLLPAAYYNFSHSLIAGEEYNDAINIVEKALAFCDEAREYKLKADLIYVAAKANILLGNISIATLLFAESYNAYKILSGNKEAEGIKNQIKELYNIILD